MEYLINCLIDLSPSTKTTFSSKIDFTSSSKATISLSSKHDECISVTIKLIAADDNTAGYLALLELTKICNILSFNNIFVVGSHITGMSSNSSCQSRIRITVTPHCSLALGGNALTKLTEDLKKTYSLECEEALTLWRDATNKDSTTEQFFHLYRLMEYILGAKNVDLWIRTKDPSVKLMPSNSHRKQEHTIYTYLRDNIHYKEDVKRFPIQEVASNLKSFKELVKQAIKERFNL
jgi:hypothetical protein